MSFAAAGQQVHHYHSPLEGESQKPSRVPELSCIELVEMSKGRRRLMRWGNFDPIPHASISTRQGLDSTGESGLFLDITCEMIIVLHKGHVGSDR